MFNVFNLNLNRLKNKWCTFSWSIDYIINIKGMNLHKIKMVIVKHPINTKKTCALKMNR